MRSLFEVIYAILEVYKWLVIVDAIASWMLAFNAINTGNRFVQKALDFLHQITEPALRPIRKIVPPLGGIDISPIILIFIIFFIQRLIENNIFS